MRNSYVIYSLLAIKKDTKTCTVQVSNLRLFLIFTKNQVKNVYFIQFSEDKMSINPGSYKLSEKTGKLTSSGKYNSKVQTIPYKV